MGPGLYLRKVCVCECEPPANSESLVRLGGIRITLEMSVYAVGGRTRRRVYTTSINQRASKRQRCGTHTHTHTHRNAAKRESKMSCVGLGIEPPSNTAELILHIVRGTSRGTAINKPARMNLRECAQQQRTAAVCVCVCGLCGA